MSAQYTLILGTKNWSSWSLRPYLALRATGAPFEETTVRLRRPDTAANIRRLASSNRVPVLRIAEEGKDFTVFDSLAICETLAERHPQAQLWPADAAARGFARSISAAMHSGFAALRATLSMEFACRLPQPELSQEVTSEIAEITGYWREALSHSGGPFLFGAFTLADCMYAPVVSRFRTYGITLDAALEDYCGLMFELPAMRDWLASAEEEVKAGLP